MFRQSGRTTVLAEAALKIDAIFLVHNLEFAKHLKLRYPELQIEFVNSRKIFSTKKPIIYDHLAINMMLKEQNMEIARIRAEARSSGFIEELNSMKQMLREANKVIRGLEEEGENLQDKLDEYNKNEPIHK